jgi:transcriptional regulator with XRE-family HTH domain
MQLIIYKDFGKFLADCRKKSNLTQLQAAGLLGHKTKQHISNIERGDSFSLILGVALARIYKVPKTKVNKVLKANTDKYLKFVVDEVYKKRK